MSESFQASEIDAGLANITVKKTPHHTTRIRLYVPTTGQNGGVWSKKLPLVVYYHAGGFITQGIDLKPVHDSCNLMARELNVVVASASYRVAPEFRLPAAYEDGVDAVEWLSNSSEDDEWIKSYADLSNVLLVGTNSGGNVAYNVGVRLTFRNLTPLRIRGLILHEPFFGGEKRCESELRHVNGQAVRDFYWKLCLPEGASRDHKYSNPTVGDGPDDMEKIGGMRWKVIVTGEGGRALIDRQRDVAKLLKEKGVDVVERFTDDGDGNNAELGDHSRAQTLFASIRSLIHSCAP
ncbi:unnamed protein product [Eruca vesicaria subsp. sativa]|uniref:Alpha/beta hydrolase fold-3 domain-containing protein n=1 Tax=Eruca vesicaria subsp. sativa TaxID=29727 RepID=A0ABC8L7C1_ERUVS|nr:unnamed protein product [Eruca vesicaria subsp. sativa]